MTQQTPQSTRSSSGLVIAIIIVALIVAALLLAFCPKPKPVPADTKAPATTIAPANGPEQKDDERAGG